MGPYLLVDGHGDGRDLPVTLLEGWFEYYGREGLIQTKFRNLFSL